MIRKRFYITILLLLFVVWFGRFLMFSGTKASSLSSPMPVYIFSENEIGKLKEGDVILRLGYGYISDKISALLDEKYTISHCGIIVKSESGGYDVIHSVSGSLSDEDGVQSCSLQDFCDESMPNSILVTRIKTKGSKDISKTAHYYLAEKIPFDYDFDLQDSTKMFCSELIWRVLLESCQVDVYPIKKKPDEVLFEAFYKPDYFEIIINHQNKENNKQCKKSAS